MTDTVAPDPIAKAEEAAAFKAETRRDIKTLYKRTDDIADALEKHIDRSDERFEAIMEKDRARWSKAYFYALSALASVTLILAGAILKFGAP